MKSESSSTGMQRQGTHLFSLPSSRKNRHRQQNSVSTIDSISTSASGTTRSSPSQSPEANSIPLSSSSRSSLAGDEPDESTQEWSLLSVIRVERSSGMVLIALYHLATTTLYTWPLQTNPSAPQPKQGTVFIAPMYKRAGTNEAEKERITSESLKILSKVLSVWMRQGASRRSPRAKLGEREEDTDWLRQMLGMPKMEATLVEAILEKQIVRPVQEWSSSDTRDAHKEVARKDSANSTSSSTSGRGKTRILNSLNTNVERRNSNDRESPKYGNQLTPLTNPEIVPSIEISSPATSDVRSKTDIPWLKKKEPSSVR